MEWEKKIELCKALNQERYKDAVDIMLRNESNIDKHDMDMFATGFILSEFHLLKPIAHIIRKFEDESIGNFRADMRIGTMLLKINELNF